MNAVYKSQDASVLQTVLRKNGAALGLQPFARHKAIPIGKFGKSSIGLAVLCLANGAETKQRRGFQRLADLQDAQDTVLQTRKLAQ